MKKISVLIVFLSLFYVVVNAQTENPKYDKALADSLGADQYGIKTYYLVILKSGTNKSTDKEKVSALFRGHLDNIGKMAKANKLVVAGPLEENEKDYRGIFIFSVKDKAELDDLLKSDPAIMLSY